MSLYNSFEYLYAQLAWLVICLDNQQTISHLMSGGENQFPLIM